MKALRIVFKVLVWLLVLGAIAFVGLKAYDMVRRDYLYPVKYEKLVEKYAREYSLSPALVYGVIKTESDFDKDAVSRAGAVGLMQIMPSTFEYLVTLTGEEYDPSRLTDAETNIRYGCLQLSRMQNRFGEGDAMLAAYNAGEGRVAEWLQNPAYGKDGKLVNIPLDETRAYVERVTEHTKTYIALYGAEKEWN
ncbi:MAG: lytic transglycosylase domain-containing protein [Clostridia bacterium]|nr:lytic transglycosylase domain-containing protein [Clostridia bacterium]